MIKSILALAVAFTFALAAMVHAADADQKKMASKDTKFIRTAAAGGQMEVDLGKLAAEKGSSDDVKKFGQMMVDDHTKANEELKTLASSKNVDLTKAMDSGMKKTDAAKKKLEAKSGADFDKAYMKDMVEDHKNDVMEFEDASKHCEDEDVKAWAAKTLPTLQKHLEMAKDIESKLK
jgi:putative membrane protein